ncbi:MAG: biotin--[acetyl-CoA-carboxylase] ligase, partial [Candidatus Bipolaricaulis sp.]|nr:biotin--[acetyl-CoA-carboxylase] ligase [Candidatus Bipolaricaulis sp.]
MAALLAEPNALPSLSRPSLVPQLMWLDTVDSTNAYATQRLDALSHGTFVVAKRQTGGRGRNGRSWHSPVGGIYMSAVVKSPPSCPPSAASGVLTLTMALAVCDGLDRLGMKPVLKWPNDVFVEGEKIAGVLAQATYEGGRLSSAVVGVGINVNTNREELSSVGRPATSVAVCLGRPQDARNLTYAVAERFLHRLGAAGYDGLRRDVLERMV